MQEDQQRKKKGDLDQWVWTVEGVVEAVEDDDAVGSRVQGEEVVVGRRRLCEYRSLMRGGETFVGR